MAFSFEDLVAAVEAYPQSFIKIEIIDVEFPDDVLNVDEIGSFKVKVTNTGALNIDNVTLKVKGAHGALVNSGGAVPSGQVPTFVTDFVTDEFDRITGHGGTQTLPATFPFKFQAPHNAHSLEDLIEVTLDGWNGNDDHPYLVHSKGDELVKATFAAKVVKL
jgi:hypothetical protein